jgi:hypothetical protein
MGISLHSIDMEFLGTELQAHPPNLHILYYVKIKCGCGETKQENQTPKTLNVEMKPKKHRNYTNN